MTFPTVTESKLGQGTWEVARALKCLPGIHDDLSLDP